MVGNLVMMLVDRLCVARHAPDTLATSGPAIFTSMAIIAFFCSTVGVSRSFIAQAHEHCVSPVKAPKKCYDIVVKNDFPLRFPRLVFE